MTLPDQNTVLNNLIQWGILISFCCSWLHSFLPPWEFLDDFPQAQKFYKAFIYVLGYAAGNLRSTVHKDISTDNGTKTSKAANGKGAINDETNVTNVQDKDIPPTH